ncbi:MAG TPA: MFS transporter [Anaeromyxobacteraceae bacterium]|nr:MFS transporter [Anaeromyxobacteraceae bacterium]
MRALRDGIRAAVGGLPPVFWTLWAGLLVNRLASFVSTFLGLYVTREHGLGAAEAGRLVALYGVGLLVSGPLGGVLADRVGRRATMLLGLVLGGLSVAALAFVRHPAAMGAAVLLAALAGEIYRPAAQAAIADVVPAGDRLRAYGLVYWAVNLGWTFGLSLAGFLAERSWKALFLADTLTSLLFAGIVALRVPETRPRAAGAPGADGGSLLEVARDRDLVLFLGLNLASLIVFTQFQLAAPLDMAAHGITPSTFSLLMALNGIGVIVLQPTLGPWLRRFDGARLLAIASVLIGLGFGLNAVARTAPAYAAGVALWTVGEVLAFPVANATVADLAPAHLRGRYQGAFTMSWGVAFTLSPLIAGEVLSRAGAPALWAGCLALGLLVAAGHLAVAPARRRRLAAHSPR